MRKRWRCFHCDEVLTREQDAAAHFGGQMGALAACQIKGHENNLLAVIREQEGELARHRNEDTQLIRAMESIRAEHTQALRRAEEIGYDRGVRDMNDQLAAATA